MIKMPNDMYVSELGQKINGMRIGSCCTSRLESAPHHYIRADQAREASVPDEVKYLVFRTLKHNNYDWSNEEYNRVQDWLDSLPKEPDHDESAE